MAAVRAEGRAPLLPRLRKAALPLLLVVPSVLTASLHDVWYLLRVCLLFPRSQAARMCATLLFLSLVSNQRQFSLTPAIGAGRDGGQTLCPGTCSEKCP